MMNILRHVAVIPDGNRRWAEREGKHHTWGHQRGVIRFREVSTAAFKMGISHFTFWAASEDNLRKRIPEEVQMLVLLLKTELGLRDTLRNCQENKINFRVIGSWNDILRDDELLHLIQFLQGKTKKFEHRFLTVLFGYSGIQEMVEAVKEACQYPRKRPECLDEEVLRRTLWTRDLPPVDLLIRTGACEEGPNWNHNSSGFMMLLTTNAKVFSPPTLWPDFTAEMFRQTVADFSKTPRRFGA